MNKDGIEKEGETPLGYDLRSLRIRKVGPRWKNFSGATVKLAPEVAEVFPETKSVNAALQFLIRVAKENKPSLSPIEGEVWRFRLQEGRQLVDCATKLL
jgi:hypothetical protein